MQPTLSKKTRYNTLIQPPQTPNIDRSFHQNSSSSGEKRSSNFLSLSLFPLPFEKLVSISTPHWTSDSSIEWASRPWQSLLIGLEGPSHLLFATCCRAEEKNKAETGVILEKALEVDANDSYICSSLEDSNFDKDNSFSKDKDNNH